MQFCLAAVSTVGLKYGKLYNDLLQKILICFLLQFEISKLLKLHATRAILLPNLNFALVKRLSWHQNNWQLHSDLHWLLRRAIVADHGSHFIVAINNFVHTCLCVYINATTASPVGARQFSIVHRPCCWSYFNCCPTTVHNSRIRCANLHTCACASAFFLRSFSWTTCNSFEAVGHVEAWEYCCSAKQIRTHILAANTCALPASVVYLRAQCARGLFNAIYAADTMILHCLLAAYVIYLAACVLVIC